MIQFIYYYYDRYRSIYIFFFHISIILGIPNRNYVTLSRTSSHNKIPTHRLTHIYTKHNISILLYNIFEKNEKNKHKSDHIFDGQVKR